MSESTTSPTLTTLYGEQSGQDHLAHAASGSLPVHEVVGTLTANGVGTCGADDNQAQAGHLIATDTHTHTFQKVIRSGARDVNGDLPPEVWAERDVAATLSLHDLGSDTRAVDVVVHPVVTTLGDHTHALTAEGHDASEDGTGRGGHDAMPSIASETTVRRLTPLECERLQGFPDNWTEGQADSHRYKQMGNAVAVPVFAWVAKRLVAIDKEDS